MVVEAGRVGLISQGWIFLSSISERRVNDVCNMRDVPVVDDLWQTCAWVRIAVHRLS